MSSSQNNNDAQSKRMRSIRWRLAAGEVWRKIGRSLGLDILLCLVIMTTWLLAMEKAKTGNIDYWGRDHVFTIDAG
ncbi:MAG: hypothetical protein IKZ94_04100, partial [Lachnospiraceae bacterium]|nr:hypothetical protein [Lachnospiraceae bacterium]